MQLLCKRRTLTTELNVPKGAGSELKPVILNSIEIRMPGLEPISFAPKANALPIELHPGKEGGKRNTHSRNRTLRSFSFQENALTTELFE